MNKRKDTKSAVLTIDAVRTVNDPHELGFLDVNPHRNRKGAGLSNSEINKTSDRSVSKLKGLDLDIDLLSNHSR